ncbi:hypothetical protein OS493_014967 [Desmophyllum pertusum]|uniref:Uncharacterized protein n=1 Tax=Desmophyllum pertusum TaxID=174260 RepID=A0A9X0A395_9CNID|nr:hypothetical protein OS493_014967 [Desmophyllum pertusum]
MTLLLGRKQINLKHFQLEKDTQRCYKMTLKFYLITSMLLLCVFLVVIPPAFSIRCYRKACVDNDCYEDWGAGGFQCPADDDKCATLEFASETTSGDRIQVNQNNCSITSDDCDEQDVCARARAFVEGYNETLTQCSVSCCNTDMCNTPGTKKKSSVHILKKQTEARKNLKKKLMAAPILKG